MFHLRFTIAALLIAAVAHAGAFVGKHYQGSGDIDYLQLLDISARMLEPDSKYQNLSMLYTPSWNGFVEGPTWDMWWIQNSYGTSYCALPFLEQPYTTFLQNSQDLWFDMMGDGHRKSYHGWVAPDGCLCDAARPGLIIYRQGDGRVDIHDWAMEFTAAGVVLQAEALLISRDRAAIDHYLPLLKRSCAFIETRRDPKLNLFLAGPAGNLLAPSYAGWRKPDGTYGKAYLAGLSVNYIAALDRMIELEKLVGDSAAADDDQARRDSARLGLKKLQAPQGYFERSLDPDGTVHGRFGAPKHGYFEVPPNQDAMAFRVVDDEQAERIYQQIAAIPQLRPHAFILPNYPSYDDMYEPPVGLWAYGTWVNGGDWSTCEGRMIMAYARLGHHEDIRRSMKQLLKFAGSFRMDNPLVDFGNNVYQPNEPYNLCYDNFAPPAAMMRGLFEYLYKADELVLVPHIPPGITRLQQNDPVRFGRKRILLSTVGSGAIQSVIVNGQPWKDFSADQVRLSFDQLPDRAHVCIGLGRDAVARSPVDETAPPKPAGETEMRLERFIELCGKHHVGSDYILAHARLVEQALAASEARSKESAPKVIAPLPPVTKAVADKLYADTAKHLLDGLENVLAGYNHSADTANKQVAEVWAESAKR